MTLSAPVAIKLDDEKAERVRIELTSKIVELQGRAFVVAGVIPGVTLADGVVTTIAHKLGRAPIWVAPSAPRGASSTGRIEEIRDSTHDRTKVIQFKATGWGATITVDVAVV